MLLGEWLCFSGMHGFYSKRPLTQPACFPPHPAAPLISHTDAELGYNGYKPELNQNQPTVAQGDISAGADYVCIHI